MAEDIDTKVIKQVAANPVACHVMLETLIEDYGMRMNIDLDKLTPTEKGKVLLFIYAELLKREAEQ